MENEATNETDRDEPVASDVRMVKGDMMTTITKHTATLGTGPKAERDFDPDRCVVHVETSDGRTACGRRIGTWRDGWRHDGLDADCRLLWSMTTPRSSAARGSPP